MNSDKVNFLINIINDVDTKNKLRLAIRMSNSDYTNLKYDKPKMYEKFDTLLKEIDEDYRTTIINFNKYPIVNFAMVKIMEMDNTEQNQVALYLFNFINYK